MENESINNGNPCILLAETHIIYSGVSVDLFSDVRCKSEKLEKLFFFFASKPVLEMVPEQLACCIWTQNTKNSTEINLFVLVLSKLLIRWGLKTISCLQRPGLPLEEAPCHTTLSKRQKSWTGLPYLMYRTQLISTPAVLRGHLSWLVQDSVTPCVSRLLATVPCPAGVCIH